MIRAQRGNIIIICGKGLRHFAAIICCAAGSGNGDGRALIANRIAIAAGGACG